MTDSRTQGLRAIAEQAADWYLRMEEGDAPLAERQAFVAWLKASPAHIEEFMRVRATHSQLADLNATALPAVEELLAQARSNVIPLPEQPAEAQPAAAVSGRKPAVWATAASVAAAALLIAWFVVLGPALTPADTSAGDVYQTALGEQRSVLLSDGSVVELNTRSTLRVLFTPDSRLVELAAGEAVFDVAKDPGRPFRVDAGTAIVEAVGTRFNVYRQASQTVVTVVEGRVAVSRPQAAASIQDLAGPGAVVELPEVELAPGDQVAVSSVGEISATSAVDANKAVAWTDRRLVFDGDTLETVAQELNRYNRRQLAITDAALARQPISGVFNANDPETLLAFLEAVGGMRVETAPEGTGWTLYPAASADSTPEQR